MLDRARACPTLQALTSHALRARAPPLPEGEGFCVALEVKSKPLSREVGEEGPIAQQWEVRASAPRVQESDDGFGESGVADCGEVVAV